ncbi:MAG: hypothetical protein RL215_2135 [Planctomycetota bacterium]
MSDCRDIPCAVIECLEATDFLKFFRGGFDEGDGAVFCLDEEFIVPEEHMSEAVASAFPESLSGGGVNAGEDAVIESVDIVFSGDGFIEFQFKAARGWPDFGGAVVFKFCGIEQDAARVIAAAEEDCIVETDWLSHVDFVLIGPWVEPERCSGAGIMGFESITMEDE